METGASPGRAGLPVAETAERQPLAAVPVADEIGVDRVEIV
jgi:hypothetical protein